MPSIARTSLSFSLASVLKRLIPLVRNALTTQRGRLLFATRSLGAASFRMKLFGHGDLALFNV